MAIPSCPPRLRRPSPPDCPTATLVRRFMIRRNLSLLVILLVAGLVHAEDGPLLTVAEKSDYKATSRHAEVIEFCDKLAKLSPVVRLGELGTSNEGRKLPLLILADPPVATPAEAV